MIFFDYDRLVDLILSAKGTRTLNQFARDCNLSSGNLSKIINKINPNPPKPETLKCISDHAYNNVTYNELLNAAGYVGFEDVIPDKKPAKKEREVTKIIDNMREELKSAEGLMFNGNPASPEAIESILDAMRIGIEIANERNKKYIPKKYRKEE